MSIKSDVLEYLINHPNEVVSLTSMAASLDHTLEQVRNAITNLRNGATSNFGNDTQASMKSEIRIVSRGYAVRYVPPASETPTASAPEPTPEKIEPQRATEPVPVTQPDPPVTPAPSTSDEMLIPIGIEHPYSDNVDTVLAQLGPVAHKVFAFVASQKGLNVTGDEVVEATGLSRSAVSSAFYNTLFNKKQLNTNARRLFVKVGKDVYRMSVPGDGVAIGVSMKHSQFPAELPTVPAKLAQPVVTETVEKLYEDKASGLSTQKRLFEEIRTLPDGSVLIEDTDGHVYKAREI